MGLYEVAARQLTELGEEAIRLATANALLEVENERLRRTVEDLRRQLKQPPY